MPTDAAEPSVGRRLRVIRRLFRETVARCRAEYGLAAIAMACVAGSTAGLAWMMRAAVNDVFVHRDLQAMWLVAVGIIVLSILKGVADYAQGVVMTRIGHRVTAGFQLRLFDALLGSRPAFFTRVHSSKLITRINSQSQAAGRLGEFMAFVTAFLLAYEPAKRLANVQVLLTKSLDRVDRMYAALVALMHGRTTIVIAHRLSTIRQADRIYVLDRGRLVGCGRHEHLLAQSPSYGQLFGAGARQAA